MIIRDEYMDGMTFNEFIDKVKNKGEKLYDAILELPNDKYAEISMFRYNDNFYVGWTVLDNYLKKVHDEYCEVFDSNDKALNYYNNLEQTLNGRRYE
ncbi:hypothetical protein [Flavobacterium sp. HTF]|uniref:hypothetical protein n=1 Tax=Flavobacterium sp. HTF TaxID=2170732 RepID=UPI000D5F1A3B|nr:hypothetical protein [Flavobacterium sp. HTF]PWB23894.1 hypothetical protein DCO46_13240 [Flavobacterium sp. HTF]